jgi:hypothetical protein
MKKKTEHRNFADLAARLLSVPHSEVKAKLAGGAPLPEQARMAGGSSFRKLPGWPSLREFCEGWAALRFEL